MKKEKNFYKILNKVFYQPESRLFVVINDFLSVVIIISIIAIIFDSVSSFSVYHSYFLFIEYTAVVIFAVEYICRIIGSPRKTAYVFSFFGIIDIISILPTIFNVSNLIPLKSLRALRVLRFLRMIRLAKVVRFEHLKTHSEEDKIEIIKLNLKIYFFAVILTMIMLGTLVYVFEFDHAHFENIPISMLWVLECLLGGPFFGIMPETYGGIAVLMLSRFISFLILGFMVHIIGNIISYLLLGKKQIFDDKSSFN